jgi:hypothetical protein
MQPSCGLFPSLNNGPLRDTEAQSAALSLLAQGNVRLSNIRRTFAVEHRSPFESRTTTPLHVEIGLLNDGIPPDRYR